MSVGKMNTVKTVLLVMMMLLLVITINRRKLMNSEPDRLRALFIEYSIEKIDR